MSQSTLVTMSPPSGDTTSQLLIGGGIVLTANTSGQFVAIPAALVPSLLAQGWSIVVTGGTTHVP